ncbi:mycothione reductase [Corynebacterium glaucum]|uniref:mycothione reductase n=1 Tax=Corynebacterium glaucum TaxID=187491 RepID=UPI00265947BE|nr:mycothione reductase [Corynebacterium glaucum]
MAGATVNATHYDLIIVGTGSGNSILDERFDDKRVAIVEQGKFGGTCLNVGCIPTKMYVLAADTAFEARDSARLGIDLEFKGADWPAIVDRVFTNRIDLIAAGGEEYRRGDACPNVDVYDMPARFVGERTLSTGQAGEAATITADQIILAAGSRPRIPDWAEGVTYHTNDDIMRLPEQPESLTIVGGGFIAMEFAHVFEALGTEVTIVSRSPFLRTLDGTIGEQFNDLAEKRFNVKRGNVVSAREVSGGIELLLDDDSVVTSQHLLIATGRIPNGDLLHAPVGGVEFDPSGRVQVDEYGRTSAEGVWALGDVSSPYQLKHVANAEARAVAANVVSAFAGEAPTRTMPHDHVPWAVFTHPQIAAVGMTEDQAVAAGHDITVKVQNYGDVAYGWALEDSTGMVKLIADRTTGRLLGAHYMGPQASTLIQQAITIMAFDLDLREVPRKQYWIHPALAEVTENAILGLDLTFAEG